MRRTMLGGGAHVDTDEMRALAADAARLGTTLSACALELAFARLLTSAPHEASRWNGADPLIAEASDRLGACAGDVAELASALSLAAELYAGSEDAIRELFDAAASLAGATAGAIFRGMILPLVGPAVIAASPLLIAYAASPGARSALARVGAALGSGIATWIAEHPRAIANPAATFLVRGLVSGSDDVIKGALGIPVAGSLLIDAPGLTVPGVAAGLGLLGVGALRETPVAVTGGAVTATRAPGTVAELASRIPASAVGRPQIRIEHYEDGDEDSWVVYIGGTVDMGVGGGDEAFDMESNAAMMADADGAGYRAVMQAMADAGIGAEDDVVIAGHSQGGIIGERVVASGEYAVSTLVTFGSPSTDAAVPEGTTVYAVEHAEDLIPALGGHAGTAEGRVTITREAFGDDAPDDFFSGHRMEEYERTAADIDASAEPEVRDLADAVARIGGGGDGTAVEYRAERVTDAEPSAPAPPVPAPSEPAPSGHDPVGDAHRGRPESAIGDGGRAGGAGVGAQEPSAIGDGPGDGIVGGTDGVVTGRFDEEGLHPAGDGIVGGTDGVVTGRFDDGELRPGSGELQAEGSAPRPTTAG